MTQKDATAAARGPLDGKRVALTGRLASMTRREALRAIADAGGRYSAAVDAATALLVLGQHGWPLAADGHLTAPLRRARALQRAGSAIEIVAERAFLARLGVEPDLDPAMRLLTTAELCRILHVPARRLRRWLRAGLIRPRRTVGRLMAFDFAQVSSAVHLHQLASAGATPARIRRSLAALQRWLPDAAHSVAQLEALERGALHVRLENGRLAEPSGQLCFDFSARADAAPPVQLASRRAVNGTREAWFETAFAAEREGRLEDAAHAYQLALRAGGPDAELAFNLGNALYALGRKGEAAQRYMQAIEIDPDYAEAWNNLGNALCDQRRHEPAVEAYETALRLDPSYGDVHYNLAEALDQQGRRAAAREHWRAYLAHDRDSPWAKRARRRLGRGAD